MDNERIRPTIDVNRMDQSHVVIVGGAHGLARDLVRCGLGAITLIDFDHVAASNPSRQDFYSDDVGRAKVLATAIDLKRINPNLSVETIAKNVHDLAPDAIESSIGSADLLINATDSFPAQAWGNRQAIDLGVPAIWIGIYRQGRAGEIVYWAPGVTPACYRCICAARYKAFEQSDVSVASTGGTILDLHLVDAIAGQIAVGILTRGAENRMGRLIEQLGDRNFLQVKIDPEYRLGDKDIFGHHLGTGPAQFSFSTIALSIPRDANCPDCTHLHTIERAEA